MFHADISTRFICHISELCYLFTSLHVRNPIIQISWLCRPPILVRWEDSATISPVASEEGVEEPNWYLHYSKSCQNPSSILSCFWIFISLRKLDIYDMIFIDKTMDKDNKTYRVCEWFICDYEKYKNSQQCKGHKESKTEFPVKTKRYSHHKLYVLQQLSQSIYPAENISNFSFSLLSRHGIFQQFLMSPDCYNFNDSN